MTPEQWQRIEDLYHAAYARPPADRAAYLAEACRGDDALRRQVESLLDVRTRGTASWGDYRRRVRCMFFRVRPPHP